MEALFNFLTENSIYIVMIITLLVWAGIFLYIFNIERGIKKIEKLISEKENE